MRSAAAELVGILRERGMRLAIAESLTGGLVADAIVSVPGASAVFSGGIIAYDTALKRSLLGVDGRLLDARGPVDREVARQMAVGVRRACAVPLAGAEAVPATLGLATTGVAGPDPDPQTGQPAGTVWIGVSVGDPAIPVEERTEARLIPRLDGDRASIRSAAVAAALELAIVAVTATPELT